VTWIIGHRGSPLTHSANSLAAFEAALAEGADGVELDVHETADGRFLVHHDPHTAAGPIRERSRADTAAALRRRALPDVPVLEEVLEAVAGAREGAVVFVEVKAMSRWERLRHALAPWRSRLRLEIQSFDPLLLREMAAAADGHRLGLVATAPPGDDPAAWLLARGLQSLSLDHRAAWRGLPDALHAAGLALHLWTVDAPSAIAASWSLAPDSIITDVPARCRAYASGPNPSR